MTKCPSFQNAQRQNAQGNILPKDKMPKVTICPRRHFAQRLYTQGDNLPKDDKMPKTTFCPFFEIFAAKNGLKFFIFREKSKYGKNGSHTQNSISK